MKKILFIFACLFVASCSSTNQDARISIFPTVESSTVGRGIALSITVDDSREDGLIGTYGDGAPISTSQDLAETIGVALVESFSKQGFLVSAASAPNAIKMLVSLEDLSYVYRGRTVASTATTGSRVRVDVSEKGFIRTYTNSEDRTLPFASNQDTNNSQLSSTLGDMVERIVNDPDLIDALVR